LLFAATENRQIYTTANRRFANQAAKVLDTAHALTSEFENDVAFPQSGFGGGAPLENARHFYALRLRQPQFRSSLRVNLDNGNPKKAATRRMRGDQDFGPFRGPRSRRDRGRRWWSGRLCRKLQRGRRQKQYGNG
jgi:hypothetical protein